MADEKKRIPPKEDGETFQDIDSKSKDKKFWSFFWNSKFLAVLLGLSLGANAIGIAATRYRPVAPAEEPVAEISLGNYKFVDPIGLKGEISQATFSVHVALLGSIDVETRRQLTQKAFRIQQNIESLLRRAHGRDFEDPSLVDLKLRLQEEINRTLEVRVIREVIITDLSIERTALD